MSRSRSRRRALGIVVGASVLASSVPPGRFVHYKIVEAVATLAVSGHALGDDGMRVAKECGHGFSLGEGGEGSRVFDLTKRGVIKAIVPVIPRTSKPERFDDVGVLVWDAIPPLLPGLMPQDFFERRWRERE